MTQIIIHAGFAKTATTTLQEGVFPHLEGVNYLGVPSVDKTLDALIRAICKIDTVRWDSEVVRQHFETHLSDEDINIISYENFTLYESGDKGVVARRLQELFPQAKIIFTIRRQPDFVTSWYLQKMKGHIHANSLISIDKWFDNALQDSQASILNDLDYNDTIAFYEGLYGKEKVSVFLYEELQNDPPSFAAKLAEFIGVDAGGMAGALKNSSRLNPNITERAYVFSQFTTMFVPKIIFKTFQKLAPDFLKQKLLSGGRVKITLSPGHAAHVRSLCARGNSELMRRHGLALDKYGYPLT